MVEQWQREFPGKPVVITEAGLPDSANAVADGIQDRLHAWYATYRKGGLNGQQAAEGLADLYFAARLRGNGAAAVSDEGSGGREALDARLAQLWVLLDVDRDGYSFFRIGTDSAGNLVDALEDDRSWSIRRHTVALDEKPPTLHAAGAFWQDGWNVELRVPLGAILPTRPAEGQVIGLQVVYQVPQAAGKPRRQRWVPDPDDRDDPPRFGLLSFGPIR